MRAIVGMDVVAAVVMPAIVVVSVTALMSLVGSAREFGSTFFPVRILGTPIVNAVSGAFPHAFGMHRKARTAHRLHRRSRSGRARTNRGYASLLQHGGEAAAPHQWQSRAIRPQRALIARTSAINPAGACAGNHDGQHFIARRKKYGKERAQGNNARGIQRRGSGGKAALRHHTQKRAYNGTCGASATNGDDAFRARVVFERFHGEIGHEKERHELQGVDECMLESMPRVFQQKFP